MTWKSVLLGDWPQISSLHVCLPANPGKFSSQCELEIPVTKGAITWGFTIDQKKKNKKCQLIIILDFVGHMVSVAINRSRY